MRLPAYLASTVLLVIFLLNGCGSKNPAAEPGGGAHGGGSGVYGGGSGGSGGPISSGSPIGTGGPTGSGGTSGTGGSGGSGGSGNVVSPSASNRPDPLVRDSSGFDASLRPVQGLVNGGQTRAVVGARVYVLQANTSG